MLIAFDTETTGLSPYNGAQIFAISVCDEKFNTEYWEFIVNEKTREVIFSDFGIREGNYNKLIDILCNDSISKVGHNTKFDIKMLSHMGIDVHGQIHDTLIAAKSCYNSEDFYGLKYLAKKYIDFPDDDETELKKQVVEYRKKADKLGYKTGKKVEMDYFLPVSLGAKNNLCKKYCVNDSIRTMKLWKYYKEGMKELKVRHTYDKEMRLYPIVMRMEERGVRIDQKKCLDEIINCQIKMNEAEKEVNKFSTNGKLNLNSPKQLIPFLYQILRLPIEKRTPSGKPSTDVSVLKKYKNHPAIAALLEYRGLEKGKGYFENYIENATKDREKTAADLPEWDYRCLHPNFHQWGANTGRFSCSNPNLQNVSNDETSSGENVVNVRQVFVPRNGYVWLSFDYSQLELRIFASRANEERMLDAFRCGRDIHDQTRRAVLPLLPDKQGRKIAKNINFLKVFGGGARTLSAKYDIPIGESKEFLSRYSREFPRIDQYIQEQTREASQKGYIINAFNRKLYIDPDKPYIATNYDVQSSAADLMKNAMIRTADLYPFCHLILSVHDELIFELPTKYATKNLAKKLKTLMENHLGVFSIEMPVSIKYTKTNWGELQDISL